MEITIALVLFIASMIVFFLSHKTTSVHNQNNTTITLNIVNMNQIVTSSEDEFEEFVEDVLDSYLRSDYVPVTSNQLQDIIQMRQQWLNSQIDLSTKMIPVKEGLLVKDLTRAEEFLVEIQKDRATRKRLKGYKNEVQMLISLLESCRESNPILFFRQDFRTPEDVEKTGGPEVTGLQKFDEILFSRLTKQPLIEEANRLVSRMARDMHDLSRHITNKAGSERDLIRMTECLERNNSKLSIFIKC